MVKKSFWEKYKNGKEWFEVGTTVLLLVLTIMGFFVISKTLVETKSEILICPTYGTICGVYTLNTCGKELINQCCLKEPPAFAPLIFGVTIINKGLVPATNIDVYFQLEGFKPNCVNNSFLFKYTQNETRVSISPLTVESFRDTRTYTEELIKCEEISQVLYPPYEIWTQKPFEFHIKILKPNNVDHIEFNIPNRYILEYPTKIKFFVLENGELKESSVINIEYKDELNSCLKQFA